MFRGYTYYKINNLDNRISNPDQLLTADVDKFCDMFTDLYSNLCKPFLDIVIYVYKLTTTLGFQVNFLKIYIILNTIIYIQHYF